MIKYITILWTALVVIGSLLPASNVGMSSRFPEGTDKIIHVIMYMGVCFLWSRWISKSRSPAFAGWVSFIGSICLGVLMEILQGNFFSGRSFEYLDIIANISGSILGTILFNKLLNQKLCFQI